MTPEMQKKMEELLLMSADCGMFSSPDRWAGFRGGFKAAHDLMQKKVKPLVEALRFYADKNNWYANGAIGLHDLIVKDDLSQDDCLRWVNQHGGKRAREALKGWE